MDEGILKPAKIPPIPNKISPSFVGELDNCGLRYAWQISKEPGQLPLSPKVRLGTIIHRIYNSASKGEITIANFSQIWTTEVKKEEDKMSSSWLERNFVPLIKSVSEFELKRVQTLNYISRISEKTHNPAPFNSNNSIEPEKYLSSENWKLSGQIDAIITTEHGTIIRDYKTGKVYEDSEEGEVLKNSYKNQLMLYAFLYKQERNEWPIKLEIVTSQGEVIDIPYEKSDCENLAQNSLTKLKNLAEKIESLQEDPSRIMELGNPGDTCTWCQYRPSCPAYKDFRKKNAYPEGTNRFDLWGTFNGQKKSRAPFIVLELKIEGKLISVQDLNPTLYPILDKLTEKDSVGIFNAKISRNKQSYLADLSTVLYKIT